VAEAAEAATSRRRAGPASIHAGRPLGIPGLPDAQKRSRERAGLSEQLVKRDRDVTIRHGRAAGFGRPERGSAHELLDE
jgi:hypothetical protein